MKEALKLALEALKEIHVGNMTPMAEINWNKAITIIKEALAQPEQEPVAHAENVIADLVKEEMRYYFDGHYIDSSDAKYQLLSFAQKVEKASTVTTPPQPKEPEQEPYCWTWDEFVSGGKWRAEYGWKKPTGKVTNLQPLYTTPPQRKPLTDEQIYQMWTDEGLANSYDIYSLKEHVRRAARAIEAAHGIKE